MDCPSFFYYYLRTYLLQLLKSLEPDKDSGYKGSSVERELNASAMSCDDSISEKEPLQSVDNITLQNIDSLKVEFNEDSMRVESSEYMKTNEDDMEFSITRQVFTETRSSMFMYESPVKDKRLKRDVASQSRQRLSQSSVNELFLFELISPTY